MAIQEQQDIPKQVPIAKSDNPINFDISITIQLTINVTVNIPSIINSFFIRGILWFNTFIFVFKK
jgi:hypothetical protein